MVTLIFESHATTKDNESNLTSSSYDVELSAVGQQQAADLGERYKGKPIDIIFCPDSQRAYTTAVIAFGDQFPIVQDERLRECDYGDMTRHSADKIHQLKAQYIDNPFPAGESIREAFDRVKDFLDFALKNYDGKTIMIIADHGIQQALEHWIKGTPIEELVGKRWSWQPGWFYELKNI
jgi:broad specificity phosphatase PhoE